MLPGLKPRKATRVTPLCVAPETLCVEPETLKRREIHDPAFRVVGRLTAAAGDKEARNEGER